MTSIRNNLPGIPAESAREGSTPKEGSSMSPSQTDEGMAKLPRVSIDLKIPLWGIMGVVGTAALVAAFMYFTLVRVAEDVIELKATMKSSNAQTIQFAQEQALIKFRVEKLEAEGRK